LYVLAFTVALMVAEVVSLHIQYALWAVSDT
jgi:hypothetical protein